MSSSFLPPPSDSVPVVLTPNQTRATEIMKSALDDTQRFFNNWRGDVLRFLDAGYPAKGPDLGPDKMLLQAFLNDWQTMAPGAPGQFFAHSASAVTFFESLWPGITAPVLVNVQAFTINADGSVTLS